MAATSKKDQRINNEMADDLLFEVRSVVPLFSEEMAAAIKREWFRHDYMNEDPRPMKIKE